MNNFELSELNELSELFDELINGKIDFQRCSQFPGGTQKVFNKYLLNRW